ncbi:MAG TPA: LysR family transcriptional regulator [Phenylobacterium sp.]|uniref:LysR family transcriptional regulator n=1 Tax=Phenylobacterium sp. TaxID=1871053 RepID=UPI002B4707E3|nr:LysR family transcriptional regulator [Phenylobacterium sp.]HKR86934.1 LysR family transcriptional regulator [Phenylobacterium sp.]
MQETIDPDLALFAHVVTAGSIAAAARRIGLSAPMVSRRLSRLEARLGVALIRRTTRRLELTAQGEVFYRDVREILAAIEQAEARLAGVARIPAGPLKVSAPTSFGRLHVAPALKPFLVRHPRVALTLELSDAYVDLLAERVDLAVRITAELPAGVEAERLATSRRVLCAAPGYLVEHGAPAGVGELRRHRLLMPGEQQAWRLAMDGREVVVAGESVVRTNSSEVVRELTLAGVGISLRSLWDVSRELAAGRLVRVLPEVEGSLDVGVYAVRPRAAFTPPAVEAFVAHLRETLGPTPPWEN